MKNNKIFFRKHNFRIYHSPFLIREQETSARLVGRNFLEMLLPKMWLYPPIAISTLMPQCNWWIKYRSKSRNIFKFEFWLYSYTLSSAYSHRYTKTTCSEDRASRDKILLLILLHQHEQKHLARHFFWPYDLMSIGTFTNLYISVLRRGLFWHCKWY